MLRSEFAPVFVNVVFDTANFNSLSLLLRALLLLTQLIPTP